MLPARVRRDVGCSTNWPESPVIGRISTGWGSPRRTERDRIVDALVSWGDPDSIAVRVGQHLDAGADQVAVTVLATEADGRAPLRQWRRLAEVLISPELR